MPIMLTQKRGFFNKVFDPGQTTEISYQLIVLLTALKR